MDGILLLKTENVRKSFSSPLFGWLAKICLRTNFVIMCNFLFTLDLDFERHLFSMAQSWQSPFLRSCVIHLIFFFISTLITWLETTWAHKNRLLSPYTQGFVSVTKKKLSCGASSTTVWCIFMGLLLNISVMTVQMLLNVTMGLGMQRLQQCSCHPWGCPQDASSCLCTWWSCSSCWSAIWFAAHHSKITPNPFCKLWWFNCYGMKWMNCLCCEGRGIVRFLQERNKSLNSHSKYLGCR